MSKGLQFCLGALLLICTSVTTAGGLEPLPPGIPATTSNRNLCFNSQELEAYDANYPRIAVSGCSVGAIRPSTDVNSYRVYRDDTGGSVIDCQTTRANEFNTRFLDNFLKEVSTMADDTVRDPSATNALCISNMLYSWASADAMKNVKTRADSSSSQSKYDRMWVVGGLAATYLKNQHIQDRAAKLAINSSNKDAAIKKWLLDLGRKISAEIDENRHNR